LPKSLNGYRETAEEWLYPGQEFSFFNLFWTLGGVYPVNVGATRANFFSIIWCSRQKSNNRHTGRRWPL